MKDEKTKSTLGFVPPNKEDKSQPITYRYAFDLIKNYTDLDPALQLRLPQNGGPINGFTFDIEHLLALCSVPGVKYAHIGLAFRQNEIDNEDGYTIVLLGMDENDRIITTDYTMYDYCDPCPRRCPHFTHPDDL